MKKSFISVLLGVILQLVIVDSVFSQQLRSSLTLPEFVEPGQNFTISWERLSDQEYGITDSNVNVDSEILILQRFNAVSGEWETLFQVDSGVSGSYLENVAEEGVYEYRMRRDIITAENEDDGDNLSDESYDEFPKTIIVTALTPDQVLCRADNTVGCITIDTPNDFSVVRIGTTNVASISWGAVANTERYELESYDYDYDQWTIVYVGDQESYRFSELDPGLNKFRIRSCQDQLCGEASLSQSVELELARITRHQCEPI